MQTAGTCPENCKQTKAERTGWNLVLDEDSTRTSVTSNGNAVLLEFHMMFTTMIHNPKEEFNVYCLLLRESGKCIIQILPNMSAKIN